MRKFPKNVAIVGLLAAVALVPGLAMAQDTAGSVAQQLTTQFKDFADLLMGAMFLVGIGIGALSLLKFKAHNENPNQTKLTTPIVLFVVAAGLIGLPSYLTLTKNTVLKEGQANSIDGNAYQNIGQ